LLLYPDLVHPREVLVLGVGGLEVEEQLLEVEQVFAHVHDHVLHSDLSFFMLFLLRQDRTQVQLS